MSKKKKFSREKNVKDIAGQVVKMAKENKQLDILIVFGLVVLALILIATLALKLPVVPVCLAIVIEAGIAVMLHNVEIWVHGLAVVVQLVAGILIGRVGMMIICILLYVCAILALQMWNQLAK